MKLPQKTTMLGILMIVGAVTKEALNVLNGGHIDWASIYPAILGGWAAIHAGDQKPRGGQ